MTLVNSKYITSQGKTKLLQLGFQNNTSGQFRYLALGGEGSNAAVMEDAANFYEISGENYQRVPLEQEGNANSDTQSITLSAIFEDTNYNPSSGGIIKEIAIVDNDEASSNDTFFAFAQVPEISKTDNISLKYTVIISIL